MSVKYCEKCKAEVQMSSVSCIKCGGTSFVHDQTLLEEAHKNFLESENAPKAKPVTFTPKQAAGVSPSSTLVNPDDAPTRKPFLENKKTSSDAARIAVESARIVNAYGAYIQIGGIILGFFIFVAGIYVAHSSGSAMYGLFGLIFGAVDIGIFAVQGALFRMISNYVIARLED